MVEYPCRANPSRYAGSVALMNMAKLGTSICVIVGCILLISGMLRGEVLYMLGGACFLGAAAIMGGDELF